MEALLPIIIPAVIGLVGALIGAGASMAAIYIQARHQSRREQMTMITTLAVEACRADTDHAKALGGPAHPLSLYVDYYASIARIIEQRPLTQGDLTALTKRMVELTAVLPQNHGTRRG